MRPGRLGSDDTDGQGQGEAEEAALRHAGSRHWPTEQEVARGCLFPSAHHKADPVDSTIQTEEGIRMYIFCLPWQENC